MPSTPGSTKVVAVTFGETIPLYRGLIGEKGEWGQWEAGVQGGVFSIFDLDSQSFDLINTDFLGAAFVGYRFGDVSALGRILHQSSHLGDELLLRATRPNRVNLSYEGLDAKFSYDLPLGLRAYAGGGYLIDVDPVEPRSWSGSGRRRVQEPMDPVAGPAAAHRGDRCPVPRRERLARGPLAARRSAVRERERAQPESADSRGIL